jgi:hypothetical protein
MLLKSLIINKKVNGLVSQDDRRTQRREDQFSYFTKTSASEMPSRIPYHGPITLIV